MSEWKKLPGAPLQEQVFAIGDVHGQAKALRRALAKIKDTPRNGMPSHLVFTGDIIDRGPENLDAIEAVRTAAELAGVDKVTFPPGNHELMLLEAVLQPHWGMNLWAQNGGMAVINEVDPQGEHKRIDDIAKMLGEALEDFMQVIDDAPDYLRMGDLLFVHGGISPHVDMQAFLDQGRDMPSKMRDHWAWIRDEFLYHEGGWDEAGKLVVVHVIHLTILASALILPSRINIWTASTRISASVSMQVQPAWTRSPCWSFRVISTGSQLPMKWRLTLRSKKR